MFIKKSENEQNQIFALNKREVTILFYDHEYGLITLSKLIIKTFFVFSTIIKVLQLSNQD